MPSAELVNDDVLTEILLRLPPASVLRSRAVCKHWRDITTCPAFLAAYSRRRPLELLAYPDGFKTHRGSQNVLAAVNPLNSGDYATGRRRFLRFDSVARLVDSRDGLLLFSVHGYNGPLVICNPATRQWVGLPCLTPEPCDDVIPSGLYFHRPSGEHRVLCIGSHPPPSFKYNPQSGVYRYVPPDEAAAPSHVFEWEHHYHIFSTGAAEPRRLGLVATGGVDLSPSACLALGETLHWSYHPESGASGKLVAFDTVSETFRLIAPPPLVIGGGEHHLRLFDMDGTLAVSVVTAGSRSRCMGIWALEDDVGEQWTCRHRVNLPRQLIPRGPYPWPPTDEAVAVVEGGVLVVVGAGWVVLYGTKEKRTLSMVDHTRDLGNVAQCLYRASLVPLPEPLPFCRRPGGEKLMQHRPPDDPYMSVYRSDYGDWVVDPSIP